MSDKMEILAVIPPRHFSGNEIENKHFEGLECTCCHGSGWLWDYDKIELEKKSCSACMGSGRLDAEISIKWLPGRK